jgi:hypothetical protein
MNTMEDIRLEKSLEALYDECIAEMPPANRRNCVWARKIGELLSGMKDETNEQIAIERGFKGNGHCGNCSCGKR